MLKNVMHSFLLILKMTLTGWGLERVSGSPSPIYMLLVNLMLRITSFGSYI